ncbi:MAG: 3-deoxy-D-manno-octulosonic acid transferase [Planctomycetota bacterium]|nr:MAG: 3-deoxy-D-manno-octulosonic acid transferase [Planctomycetota bacterium]
MAERDSAYWLYDGLLWLAGLVLAPLALIRAAVSPVYRRALPGRLGFGPVLAGGARRLLLHGVSVGEVKAMRPLVAELQVRRPDLQLVLSSTTSGGRETARRLFPGLEVVTYPLDLPFAVVRFLRRVRPSAVVLMELEIWPNFLRHCTRAAVPVAIVNGRITDRSVQGYRRVQRFLPQFDRIRLYGVQNERYAERFRALHVPPDRIVVTGNLKYDNLPQAADEAAFRASPWPAWVAGRPAVALGSTHEPEERDILAAAGDWGRNLLWIVVPRHPRRAARLRKELAGVAAGRPVLLRSELRPGQAVAEGAVLVVDSFGELEHVYRACSMAFVGGSLVAHGGQNVLEPAALGRPAAVGPHTENFADEVALLEAAGGLARVGDARALVGLLAVWLREPRRAASAGEAAADALAVRRGAATCTLQALEQARLLPERGSSPGDLPPHGTQALHL